MRKYWLSIAGSALLVMILPIYSLLQFMVEDDDVPVSRQGVMDLSTWDFEHNGAVRLNGEWEFYRNVLLTPEDFRENSPEEWPEISTWIQVPDKWNKYISESGDNKARGVATYRIKVKVAPGQDTVYGLRASNIRSASRIFLNGQEVGRSGIPAENSAEGKQNNIPYMGFAPVSGDTAEVIIQAANYSYSSGGIVLPVTIGDQKSIIKEREFGLAVDGASTFGFFILAGFMLLFSRVRESRGPTLYLGLLCISGLVYVLTHGEKLMGAFIPGIPYELILKLQLASSTLVYFFLLQYIAQTLPYRIPAAVLKFAKGVTALLLVISASIPAHLFSYLEPLLLGWGVVSIGYVLYTMILGTSRQPENMFLMMVSILSLLMVILLYLLNAFGIALNYFLLPYEIILFVFVQAILMTRRYAAAFLEVEQLSRRLLTLDGLKDDFMAGTSHELRKPLQGIVNMAHTLLEGASGRLTAEQSRDISIIISIAKRLSALVNDMSDFAKLNHGNLFLRRQAVDLRMVASSVMEVTRQVLGNSRITFNLELPDNLPLLETDEERLAQILFNLLSNAVKYTPQGVITLSAMVKDGYVSIAVTDTGQGIPAESLKRIFEAYDPYGESAKKTYREISLGLSISQKLVELNGGTLEGESQVGQGSSFRFTLPVLLENAAFQGQEYLELSGWEMAAATNDKSPPAHVQSAEECCFILVVDNDPVNLHVLANALRLERHTVLTADNAPAALRVMQDYPELDLIITDWVMPDMPGLVFCKAIRERFVLSELPILVLTTGNRPEDVQAAFEAGANDYLSKPIDLREFQARVRTLLDMRRSIRTSIQTEVAFLQAQIKPHFLYNALNAIISVCPVDPETATDLLLELSQYLRSSFDFQNRDQTVQIGKELELVKSYLALEKARFDDRLTIVFDVPEDIFEFVPPLSIQPIVENAVNHGLMQTESGGTVTLAVKMLPKQMAVVVSDNGIGMSPERIQEVLSEERTSGGIGLRNIQRRLLKIYGTGLIIQSVAGEGTTVSYAIPRTEVSRGL